MTDTVIIRRYTQERGLSSYNIRRIIEDKWGFLWIATQEGISRFDRNVFTNYSKTAFPGKRIGGTDIRELIEDSTQNLIWTLSTEGTVNAISSVSGKVVKNIPIPGLGPEDYCLSMLKSANELWLGTSTGVRIFNIAQNKFVPGPSVPGQKTSLSFAVRYMKEDENKNIWACYGGFGIVVYKQDSKTILKTIPISELNDQKSLDEIRINNAILLRKGEMLMATSQGLRKISYDRSYQITVNNTPCKSLPVLNLEVIDWVSHDNGNDLLVSGFNHLYRFDLTLGHFTSITELSRTNEANWVGSVLSISQDRNGNYWLGCQEGLGFILKKRSPFKPFNYDDQSKTELEHVYAVSPINNGNILAGLRRGIVEINRADGRFVRYDSGHLYQHIFEDRKGLVHVSRPDGLFIYDNGSITSVAKTYPEFTEFSSFSINSHIIVSDSVTILGTENNRGILIWNPLGKTVRMINGNSRPLSLSSSIVNNIYRDGRGRIWVLSDNLISILSPGLESKTELRLNDPETGDNYGHFFDMCETGDNYFIASYGSGILQLDDKQNLAGVFNTRNGLSNDCVYQVYSLAGGQLLVTSNNGLSRINLAKGKISRYYKEDGLHSNAFEEVSGLMKNGKIYAGGVNGFTAIDPVDFSTNTDPPQLYFTSIEIQTTGSKKDTSNLQIDEVTIPNNAIASILYFSGINFSNPGRIEYAYRILEKSGKWIDNGNRNSIQLTAFAPGTYTIELKAANEDGVWSQPIMLSLYFKPKWYQTTWFKLLLVFLAFGIAYLFYRARIRRFKREEAIRRRLASDLHDDLGSTVNSINIFTNLAMMEDGNNSYLVKIKKGTQEAIATIRDIIWILDDKKDSVEQLVQRIRQFAHPLCDANKIEFHVTVDPDVSHQVLEKEEKRNLYMVLKEAINNSIKYAEPKSISISIRLENKKRIIRLSDEGKGFDLSAKRNGNGLGNMERRALEIGYQYKIASEPGRGTVIELVG